MGDRKEGEGSGETLLYWWLPKKGWHAHNNLFKREKERYEIDPGVADQLWLLHVFATAILKQTD